VLPRRSGARFALEALFLALLAVGAGLADLRPLVIVIVMAGAWVLIALAELSAERIDRSPLSYLRPLASAEDEDGPQEVFGPRPEERTVVAPPEPVVDASDEAPAPPEPPEQEADAPPGPQPEPDPGPEPAALPLVRDDGPVEPVQGEPQETLAEPGDEPEHVLSGPGPAGWSEPADESPAMASEQEEQAPRPQRLRGLLRRRREPDVEPMPAAPPRHVKLLPRRPADEPSAASKEVAELFGSAREEDEPLKPEETTG
jgi:hypothetical protein